MDQLRVVQDISPSSGSAKIFDISAEQPGVVQDIFPLSGSVKISDICTKDLDSIQEEICTNSDIDVDQRGVIENISPSLGSVKKGKEHADWDRISPQTIKLTTPECNTENESSDLTSDLSKDAGYLGDLETSSNEPQSSDSEDDIYITSNNVYGDENLARMMDFEAIDVHDVQSLQDTEDAEKFQEKEEVLSPKMQEAIQCLPTMADKLDDVRMEGKISDISTKDLHLAREEISTNSDNDMDQLGVVQDISPSSSSVKKSQEHVDWDRISPLTIKSTTSVEPSSEETTQFDQAEDEEKTSVRFYCFKDVEEFLKGKGMISYCFIRHFYEELLKRKVPLKILARGPEAVKASDKALTGGKACIKRIPVISIGHTGAGKSSFINSIGGKLFNEKEESTVGIDTDSLYFKVSKETWKSGKVKEELQFEPEVQFEHFLARIAVAGSEFIKNETVKVMEFFPELDPVLESDSESVLEPPVESSTRSSRHGSTKPLRNIESLHGKSIEEVARLVEKMLEEEENANHEDKIYSELWDFGGQSVYYETHPIFLKEKAIYILVSDLGRDPEERAIPPVKTGLFESKVDIDYNKTNLDYLDFWMSSIYSLVSPDVLSSQETTPNASYVLPRRLPPVFIVCTYADVPFGGSNARHLALKMYEFLQRKTYREHLYKDVFVGDSTKSGGEEECVEVRRLREEVLAVAKEMELTKEEIPVKWLRYENKLRKKRDKWITLEEAEWVAFEDCEIQEDDEFSTLLNFLHDQRIVIHFSGSPELERIVILDPQWLVDVLKNVITVRRFKHTEHPIKDLWIQLEETGILDEKLIDHAWRDLLDNQENHKSLIAVMERLSLISPWPSSKDSKQYLVPFMLMSPPTDDVLQLLDSVNVPSLFVTFASGRVPLGLFSRLISHFFQWCGEEWKSKVSPQLFHNFAMFHILPDQGISVMFWCHSTAIEVAIYSTDNDEKRVDISRAVYWRLRFILECMRKEFHWLNNVKYDMCVCCPVCSRPGSGKCHDHDMRGCECLHFWSEFDLRQRQHCDKPGRSLLGDRRIRVKQFECWFLIGEGEEGAGMSTNQPLQAIHTTSHGGSFGAKGIFSIEGKTEKGLALPENIKTSIQSIPLNSESDVKDIVIQFQEALKLVPASLTSPEPKTKSMIRCLALRAKSEKRDDLVRHLREITPAGTTGPLLIEDMSVDCMPLKQFKDLTFSLSGGDEWKLLAERLCFSLMEIRFLENRVVNPSEVVLSAVAKHRHLSVGEIYDTLVDCELPAIADLM